MKKNVVRRVSALFASKTSKRAGVEANTAVALIQSKTTGSKPPTSVFWPSDLLPAQCPESRILMYGYDTKITKYMRDATNKNSIFSHSKDLLYALCREREPDRPLIFVAHSPGGILVKEVS